MIGSCQEAADLAIELLQWSQDVVLCSNGTLQCNETARRQIRRGGIRVDTRQVMSLTGVDGDLEKIHFADGSFLERTAAFISPQQHQRSALADKLGCKFCEDGCIDVGEDGATCIPGLYAVGNASRGVQLVIVAAAEGTLAAVAINDALIEADAETGALTADE
ncbi:MAG TPA: FAD-dependent oxidoreductase [Prosthecobacter sp.]|nr:FAD-dependent oxidoreductase [Prosthecobacter sp.]